MTSVLLIPLRNGRILVHVLDDVSPTDACVVSTEGNLTFLCSVRNDAHFRAAEVVVEEILEPHACDEEKVPTIRTSLLNVLRAALTVDAAVILAGQAERLIE